MNFAWVILVVWMALIYFGLVTFERPWVAAVGTLLMIVWVVRS